MFKEYLSSLSSLILKDNLSNDQKKKRRIYGVQLQTALRKSLFQLFYKDFFSYSYWTIGYPKNSLSINIRNSEYVSYIKIIFDFKLKKIKIESINPIKKKIYGVYAFPIKKSLKEKYGIDNHNFPNTPLEELDFDEIEEEIFSNKVAKVSENIEVIELNQKETYKKIKDEEILYFNSEKKLNINFKEFDEIINNELINTNEFIKIESNKLQEEIRSTKDQHRENFLKHLIAHLNLRLINKYIGISKSENLTEKEMEVIISELYKGLFRAVEKHDPTKGQFTTYAYNRILSQFSRGKVIVARNRVFSELGEYPTYHAIDEKVWAHKRQTGEYLSIDAMVAIGRNVAMKKISYKKEKEKKRTKEKFNRSAASYLAKEIEITIKDTQLLEKFYKHTKEIAKKVLDSRSLEIMSIRYRFNESFSLIGRISLVEIGNKFGVTRERIRQLEKEAIFIIKKAYNIFPIDTEIDTDYLQRLSYKAYGRGKRNHYKNFTENKWLINFFELNSIIFLGEFKNLDFDDKERYIFPAKTTNLDIEYAKIEQNKQDENYVEDKNLVSNYDLSVRSRNVLEREGLSLVSEIDVSKLSGFKNLGEKSIIEIQNMIISYQASNTEKNKKIIEKQSPPSEETGLSEETDKETQSEMVSKYLYLNGPTDNKTLSEDLNIISHSVRRITGQETLKENFVRVETGVYDLSESKRKEYEQFNEEREYLSSKELIIGNYYIRRELHDMYGGNRQRGIVTLTKHNLIFLLNAKSETSSIYDDGWAGGRYYLTGEGLKGDQVMNFGNKALKNSINDTNPKRIYLFEPLDKSQRPFTHSLETELKCVDYNTVKKKDLLGEKRKVFQFVFEQI